MSNNADVTRADLIAWAEPSAKAGLDEKQKDDGMTSQTEAFCVKCQAKQPIKNAQQATLSNGKAAIKGQCPVCGTNVVRLVAASK